MNLWAEQVLISHRYFSHCWTVLVVVVKAFSVSHVAVPANRLGVCTRIWERTQPRYRGYSWPCDVTQQQKLGRGWGRGDVFRVRVFVFPRNCCTSLNPASLGMAEHLNCLPMRSSEWSSYLAWLTCPALVLPINLSLCDSTSFLTSALLILLPVVSVGEVGGQLLCGAWLSARVNPHCVHNLYSSQELPLPHPCRAVFHWAHVFHELTWVTSLFFWKFNLYCPGRCEAAKWSTLASEKLQSFLQVNFKLDTLYLDIDWPLAFVYSHNSVAFLFNFLKLEIVFLNRTRRSFFHNMLLKLKREKCCIGFIYEIHLIFPYRLLLVICYEHHLKLDGSNRLMRSDPPVI